MTHGLSLGSGDVLDLFGRVTRDVNDEERSGSSDFRYFVPTSCLAPFFLYVV